MYECLAPKIIVFNRSLYEHDVQPCFRTLIFSECQFVKIDPIDIESNVKRIVGEEIQKSQNDCLSKLDGNFTSRLQAFVNQQKELSETRMSKRKVTF